MENCGQFGHSEYERERITKIPLFLYFRKSGFASVNTVESDLTAARFQKVLRYLIRVGFISRETALWMGLCYPLGLPMPLIRSVRGDEAGRRICSPLTCLTAVQPNMARSAHEQIGLNQERNTKFSKCIPGHLHSPLVVRFTHYKQIHLLL